MIVPWESLEASTLRAVVEEFVTRDGTDHTDVPPRVERVLAGLRAGNLVLTFDADAGTTHVVRREDLDDDDPPQ